MSPGGPLHQRRASITAAGVLAALAALSLAPAVAAADKNDLVLSRLGRIRMDGEGVPLGVVGQNLEFRSLVSELGVVLAPHLLTPSDTLGFGGFQFSGNIGFTSTSSDASYWRALESSDDPTGAMDGIDHGGRLKQTLGFFARKGIWFPVPSLEFGVGAVHLLDSHLWTAQGYVKLGLHEGYHDLPIPSVAVRGSASRVVGSEQLDLTIAGLDLSISKQLGIAGTWNLTPYGGWNALFIIPRSEVIDATPHIDPLDPEAPNDDDLNFVFKDQDNIIRHKLFVGAKLQYYVFALTLEAALTLKGSSVDDRPGTDTECTLASDTTSCDSPDQAKAQQTYTVSLGLDF